MNADKGFGKHRRTWCSRPQPQVTAIADALIQADQARAELTAEQARSSSLTQLRSFNQRVQVASVAVQTEMTLIGKALDSPSP